MQPILREIRPTLLLAFPIILGQLSQMLIGITDNAMIGRIGTVPLAAAAFTHGVFGVFYVTGLGLLMGVGVLAARDAGAGQLASCAAWLRQGRALALVVGGGAFGALAIASTQLHRFGQPPEVVAIVRPFFLLISLSLVPVLFFQVQRQFAESLGRPWVPMVIMLGDVVVNAWLNWLLIWGHWGLPALGLFGSGLATLLARTFAVGAIALWIRRAATFKPVRTAPPLRWTRQRWRALLGIGVPTAGSLLFESGAFAAAALMMGWLGATALAAHQIALSCAASTFMFPLGLSMAVSLRLSRSLGEGERTILRPIWLGALGVSTLLMATFAAVFVVAGGLLARGFTTDPAVISVAAQLLIVAAFFQVFDGAQVVGAGALRGLTDVKLPTLITFCAYWVLALPGAYLLGVRGGFGPTGIWTALALGLGCAALLLALRFHLLTAGTAASGALRGRN
ncbi:MATE family efflux transporter [Opitutus terrae]|uniref:Multidrug-efflux transporter n=1 Tax=Opitutus terrae (strain DSM 11246 / JCM 15787 / PB90-1) TaxID=452637 RepID=B1ZST4_OPITP|nr:MATE family efflux transporter [Opitutus terrae]ACB74778.1 MATE efflux family protein [Opitutus terrae PB90-1]